MAGLFIYDVFWVFATDVMTTVARGIDAPILLQFPQDIYRAGWAADKYAMLGRFECKNIFLQFSFFYSDFMIVYRSVL